MGDRARRLAETEIVTARSGYRLCPALGLIRRDLGLGRPQTAKIAREASSAHRLWAAFTNSVQALLSRPYNLPLEDGQTSKCVALNRSLFLLSRSARSPSPFSPSKPVIPGARVWTVRPGSSRPGMPNPFVPG